jgi:hypothetical protein
LITGDLRGALPTFPKAVRRAAGGAVVQSAPAGCIGSGEVMDIGPAPADLKLRRGYPRVYLTGNVLATPAPANLILTPVRPFVMVRRAHPRKGQLPIKLAASRGSPTRLRAGPGNKLQASAARR